MPRKKTEEIAILFPSLGIYPYYTTRRYDLRNILLRRTA